jgi:hypothetical protein
MGELWPSLLIDDPSQFHVIFLESIFNAGTPFVRENRERNTGQRRVALGLKQDQAVFEDVAEAFRAAGGTLENLRLGQGTRGRGLFVIDPLHESRLIVPKALLLPVDQLRMLEGRPSIKGGADITPAVDAFYAAYFNSIGFPKTAFQDAKKAISALHRLPGAVQDMMLKGSPDGVTRYPPFDPDRVLDWHIEQRCLRMAEGQRVVIPMMELANHDSGARSCEWRGGDLVVEGLFADEFLLCYHTTDCWTTYLNWGFVAPSDRVVSLGVTVNEPGGWRIRVVADGRSQADGDFTILSADGGVLNVSRLLLVGPAGTDQARVLFRSRIAAFGVANPDELFSIVSNINRDWYENLLKIAKGATRNAALTALRQAAKFQHAALES